MDYENKITKNDIEELCNRLMNILKDKMKIMSGNDKDKVFSFNSIYHDACFDHTYQYAPQNEYIKSLVKQHLLKNEYIKFIDNNSDKIRSLK
jgi:hypothetical protein